MEPNKHVVDDHGLRSAGFQNQSEYDLERQRILREMAQYSPLSSQGYIYSLIFSSLLFGLHRFRTGKYFTGILYALTGGGFCIWTVLDIIAIASGKWTDKEGLRIHPTKYLQLEYELNSLKAKYANR